MREWFKEGQLDTAALDKIEADLKAVTDQTGRLMDQVQKKGFVPVFQCGHSGLLFPGDYAREYGRLYGIGLGPDVCSEVLDTDYETAPPPITSQIRRVEQIMFPVRASKAQVDLMLVSPEEFSERAAILAVDDPDIDERAEIVRAKQLKNPRGGQLVSLYADWNRIKAGR